MARRLIGWISNKRATNSQGLLRGLFERICNGSRVGRRKRSVYIYGVMLCLPHYQYTFRECCVLPDVSSIRLVYRAQIISPPSQTILTGLQIDICFQVAPLNQPRALKRLHKLGERKVLPSAISALQIVPETEKVRFSEPAAPHPCSNTAQGTE